MGGFNTVNDSLNHVESYDNKFYIGTVTANNDPEGLGRIQANVPGLYNSTEGEVPWIGPHRESPFGFGKSETGPYGIYGVPPIGATVKVELQDGDEHRPLYSNVHTKPSVNPVFMSPTVWGFQDPSGTILIVDMNAGTWKFVHSSGSSVEYFPSGDLTLQAKGNISINASANINFTAEGTATYTASTHTFHGPLEADSTISAAGDITDQTSTGNSQTMGNMRTIYNEHRHEYDDNGTPNYTDPPIPQIPT